jgi:hypothetical protein
MPIILLDLNFTLVANSRDLGKPFLASYPVERETYRQWLVDLVRPHTVALITARPTFLRSRTMYRIAELTRWKPVSDHFNSTRLRAPEWKRRVITEEIFPKWGKDPGQYLALESNADTRAMYAEYGIAALPVPYAHAWSSLPELEPKKPEPDDQQTLF